MTLGGMMRGGGYDVGGGNVTGGFAVWGQPAAIEHAEPCRGLCGIIGVSSIELRGRNLSSQVSVPQ